MRDTTVSRDPKVLAEALLAYRKRYSLTQKALAEELGVSMQTLRRWEHGNASFGCLVMTTTDTGVLLFDEEYFEAEA
jgi:predicted transcriptional regulator